MTLRIYQKDLRLCSGKSCIAFCRRDSSRARKSYYSVGSARRLVGQAGDRHGTFGSGRGSEVYGGSVFWFSHASTGGVAPTYSSIQGPAALLQVLLWETRFLKTFGPGMFWQFRAICEVKFTRTNKTKKLMKGFAPIVKIEG